MSTRAAARMVDSIGLATRMAGTPNSGPAVIWIHGYTMDSSTWDRLWAKLPGWFHVGIDLFGHGGSRGAPAGLTLPMLAGTVADLAREFDASRVVGLSFGSSVALQWAIDQPDEVSRLVVGAPTIAGVPAEPGTERRYKELMMLQRFVGPGEQMAALWMSSPPDIFRGTERHPQLREQLRSIILRHSWGELSDGSMARLTGASHPDSDLALIRARTLAVIGDQDMPSFLQNADRLVRVVPGATVASLPDAGHLVLIEEPDTVAPLLEAHLR